jgi:hypothetical protein
VNLAAYRLAKQNELSAVDYHDLTIDNIDKVTDKRLQALKEIEKDKIRVARANNKKVKLKSFQVGDLVWKTMLPVGTKDHKFGKWSLSWEAPYTIVKVITGNSYMLKILSGEHLPRALNGRYLKKILPKCVAECLSNRGRCFAIALGRNKRPMFCHWPKQFWCRSVF